MVMKQKGVSVFSAAGFTLTELIAVVVIIAILAALGLGTYSRAVERARFSEGLSAAANLAQAVDRYYYDNMDMEIAAQPTLTQLDISFPNQVLCSEDGTCVKTKYFTFKLMEGYVSATRNKTTVPYEIRSYFSTGDYRDDRCFPRKSNDSGVGKDFCISLGYTCGANFQNVGCTKG